MNDVNFPPRIQGRFFSHAHQVAVTVVRCVSFLSFFSVVLASLILYQASGVRYGCSLEVRLFSEKFSGKVHPERGVGSVRVRPCWERRETEHKKYMASLPGLQKRKS